MLIANLPMSLQALTIDPPRFPVRGYKGSKARGRAYERKVGEWLKPIAASLGAELHDHPWLAGPCQPDFVIEFASSACIVVEAKLTQANCAAQLNKYRRALFPRQVITVQVCRRLIFPASIDCFEELTDNDTMLLWL